MRIPIIGPSINRSSEEYMSQRDRVPWQQYVQTLSVTIVSELRATGRSPGLEIIRDTVLKERSVGLLEKMAVLLVANEMSATAIEPQISGELYPMDREIVDPSFIFLLEVLRAHGKTCAVQREERQNVREGFFARPREDVSSIRQAAEEEARRIKEEAARQAKKTLDDAKEEAEGILNEARANRLQAQSLREDAEHAAQEIREQAREQAERQYEEQKEQFRPRAIREMLDEFRAQEQQGGEEGERRAVCEALNRTRSDVCEEITHMQAGLNDLFSDMKNRMNSGMIKWREEIYRMETMELATCYVSLCNIISSIDRKIAEEAIRAEDEEQPVNDIIRTIRKNLGRFEKQMRKAMLGMGLDVYMPQVQEPFDPAQHTLADSYGEEDDRLTGCPITGCKRPGVRHLDAATGSFEAMIRADVTIEQEDRQNERYEAE